MNHTGLSDKDIINKILDEYSYLIDDDRVLDVYDRIQDDMSAYATGSESIQCIFSEFLLENNVNPLEGSNYVPQRFLEGSTKVNSYVIPRGIDHICKRAFCISSIESVTIPDTVKIISDHAFDLCNIETIEIPESVTDLGLSAFRGTHLREVKLSSSLVYIPTECFYCCDLLKNIDIPEGVKVLGIDSFKGSGLRDIRLPRSLRSLQHGCLHCNKLQTIIYEGSQAEFEMLVRRSDSDCIFTKWAFNKSDLIDSPHVIYLSR